MKNEYNHYANYCGNQVGTYTGIALRLYYVLEFIYFYYFKTTVNLNTGLRPTYVYIYYTHKYMYTARQIYASSILYIIYI